MIRKAFSQFGTVKCVENVSGSSPKKMNDVHEAYVLFEKTEDAYKAFMANRDGQRSSDEIVSVLPVNTWKVKPAQSQSEELSELSRRIANIDNEDDDSQFVYKMYLTPGMLLRIFRLFIRSSKDFLTGLYLHYPIDDESIHSDDDDSSTNDSDSETKASSAAAAIEKLLSNLKDPDIDKNCITSYEFEKRIAEVVVKHIGKAFNMLTIQKCTISMEMLLWFAPVLKRIKTLRIHTEYDCSILYALSGFCPNVSSFYMDGEGWDGDFVDRPVEKWPSLNSLSLNVCEMDDEVLCNEGNRKLQRFIEANPQITVLQFESVIDLEIVSSINKTLKNLNTFAFVRQNFENLNLMLDNLMGLTKLQGIKFTALEVKKNDLNALVKCAKRLSRLPDMQLITIFLNCEPNTEDEEEEDFDHLKDISITHHFDCKCHGPNRTISFDEFDVEVPYDSLVFVQVINTKPPALSKDKTLKASILKTFKKSSKFFPNVIKQIEQPDDDNHLFIHISSNHR